MTNQPELRDRIVDALLAPRYGGPQHNTPGGLSLTATPDEARRHRAGQMADVVLAVLPASVDRATVLRKEAALIRAHCPDHLDSNSADGSWINCHCDVADDMERRAAKSANTAHDDSKTGRVVADDTIWLERRPCGCIVAAVAAHVPGEWTLTTAQDVALHFHPTEGERRRAAEAGLTVEPVTSAQYREQFRDRWHCNRHAAAQHPAEA